MKLRSTLHPRNNILTTGVVLLLLFGSAIFLVSQTINRIARKMNRTIVTEVCDNHYALLQAEFEQCTQPNEAIGEFLQSQASFSLEKLSILIHTLQESDPKIYRIRLTDLSARQTYTFLPNGQVLQATATAEEITANAPETGQPSSKTTGPTTCPIYQPQPKPHLSFNRTVYRQDGRTYCCRTEINLSDLYVYFTSNSRAGKSYATVYETTGIVITHPDSLLIGKRTTDATTLDNIAQTIRSGNPIRATVRSEYLGVPVHRVYFPMDLAGERWVAAVSVPQISVDEEVNQFHRYTIALALLSIALFIVLLILFQRRWKKEYELRRQAEQESAKLYLQQLIDQINPHFLFNSLTSLYVLIADDTRLAREFVLKLSGVYRYVLERGKDTLSSLEDEIGFTMQYYFLQKIRFEEQIDISITTDLRFNQWLIPSMSLQMLVENAIKHNKITPTNPLKIRIYTNGRQLVIENNYTPREDSDNRSMGTGLERIRTIYRFFTQQEVVVCIDHSVFRCTLPLLAPDQKHKEAVDSLPE